MNLTAIQKFLCFKKVTAVICTTTNGSCYLKPNQNYYSYITFIALIYVAFLEVCDQISSIFPEAEPLNV